MIGKFRSYTRHHWRGARLPFTFFAAFFLNLYFFSSPKARAREYHNLFATAEMVSMGFATTATTDDHNSLYSNPAGLAQLEEAEIRFPDLLHVEYSRDMFDLTKRIKNIDTSASKIAAQLKEFDGRSAYAGLNFLGFGYYGPRIALAMNVASFHTTLRIRTPSALFARAYARTTLDSGPTLGLAYPFFSNHFRVGLALRPVLLRGGFEVNVDGNSIKSLSKPENFGGLGWGSDMDAGIQSNTGELGAGFARFKVMGGVAGQNLIATKFRNRIKYEKYTGKIPPLERRVNVGTGISMLGMGKLTPTFTVEVRELGIPVEEFIERLSSAIELAFRPRSWFHTAVRGHFYKGNIGGGASARLGAAELELGTYAVSLGRGVGVGVDRRLYAQFALTW